MNTDLAAECNPLLPVGWTFELHMSRSAEDDFSGVGVLLRHGLPMCHLTLPGLGGDRAQALGSVQRRVEEWLAEWQSRGMSPA